MHRNQDKLQPDRPFGSYADFTYLRTFARKFSNIDFSLRILLLKDDELAMSEMYKKWGVTDFVLERACREERPKSAKSGFVTE